MGIFKVPLPLLFGVKLFFDLSLLEFSSLAHLGILRDPEITDTVSSFWGSGTFIFTMHCNPAPPPPPCDHCSPFSSLPTNLLPSSLPSLLVKSSPSFSNSGGSSLPPAPFSDSLRELQLNSENVCARSVELFHFVLLFLVDRICIQKSELNSFSSFRIPRYCAPQCDRTHSPSCFVSSGDSHNGDRVVIFVSASVLF